MDALVAKKFHLFFVLTFCVGFVNNLGYVMVATGAQNVADHFNEDNLMPLFQFMLVGFDLFMQFSNVRWLLHIPHMLRFEVVTGMSIAAYVLMAVCSNANGIWGFYVALFASALMGVAQCLGEAVMLGFLKAFPSELVVGFSSGTGFAGVGGTLLWVIFRLGGVSDYIVFLTPLPLMVLYLGCLFYLNKVRKQFLPLKSMQLLNTQGEVLLADPETNETGISSDTGNAAFSLPMIKVAISKVWFWAGNLGLVYFLEYCITTGFADRASLRHGKSSFFDENSYIILSLCYQSGVLLSRSSLKCFKIKKVWIMTLLQALNFTVWWVEAMHIFLGVWGEFAWMIWVGCLGGASYVNVAYLILNTDRLAKEFKESALTYSLFNNNLGVMFAAAFCLLLDNTLIKK